MENEPAIRGRDAIGRKAPEIRVKVTPDLYRALNREAAAEDITVAALLRRIVAGHYEVVGEGTLEHVRAALAEASAERQLLVVMLDLMYQGLLVRLDKPNVDEIEARIAGATEGHRKWRTEIARRLADGAPDTFLALIRDLGKPNPDPTTVGTGSSGEASA